ncbi:RNA-binding protein [Lentilactobacillus laojiaonis]|uniref:YlmH family RNA-binding protein n=1 Tax=Lentilactobacillus laojiaonis TaxID=2883998 RepID=UPI001D09B52C|nr:RNA-binding protein [Lentilactobacillus laojiaonis]UDM32478.1 RNA-binding protein [Lentilactobacillus laojiaonis]
MLDSNIEQHYRPNELGFVQSIDELVNRVENEYRPILTDFLNPREQFIAQTIVNRYDDIKIKLSGGYLDSEAKRALIYPDYFEPQDSDFNLSLVEVNYPVKFSKLAHGKILGTLLGSGIKRQVVGDIITNGNEWQLICETEIVNYLALQIDRIGKIKVSLKVIDFNQILIPNVDGKIINTTITSQRLDVLISDGFNLSRQHSKELVENNRVKVNWSEIVKPDYEIQVNDVISIRKYGRLVVKNIFGKTKKDKLKVELQVITSK